MISPIQSQILLDILLKVRFISIEICTREVFTHQLMCCHHSPDWWSVLLVKAWQEKIIQTSPTRCMLCMLKVKIQWQWRLSSVKKLLQMKINFTYNSTLDVRKNSKTKVFTKTELFSILLTKLGIFCPSSKEKNSQRSTIRSRMNSIWKRRRNLMRRETKND